MNTKEYTYLGTINYADIEPRFSNLDQYPINTILSIHSIPLSNQETSLKDIYGNTIDENNSLIVKTSEGWVLLNYQTMYLDNLKFVNIIIKHDNSEKTYQAEFTIDELNAIMKFAQLIANDFKIIIHELKSI